MTSLVRDAGAIAQTASAPSPGRCHTRGVAMIEHLGPGPATLERCADLIDADPIGCNMAATVIARGADDTVVLRAHRGDATLGAVASWGPGYTMTRLRPDAATAIAGALPADGRFRLDGDIGDVAAVAGSWSERTGGAYETIEIFRVYRLGELRPPAVDGEPHVADASHLDAAARWAVAFGDETGLGRDEDADAASEAAHAQMTRAIGEGRLRTWRVGSEIVSQLLVSAPCARTVRIGAVYTPPHERGRGYAAALTAAVAAGERSRPDVEHVMLNTQASNAMTNRLYRRLGFESSHEMLLVWLVGPDRVGGDRVGSG